MHGTIIYSPKKQELYEKNKGVAIFQMPEFSCNNFRQPISITIKMITHKRQFNFFSPYSNNDKITDFLNGTTTKIKQLKYRSFIKKTEI